MNEILDEIEEFQSEKFDSFIEQCDLTDGEIPQKFDLIKMEEKNMSNSEIISSPTKDIRDGNKPYQCTRCDHRYFRKRN